MLTARDYLENDVWKAWKADFDELMAYRKTIKDKPDVYQSAILKLNQPWIEFYKTALFHVAGQSDCGCRRCQTTRQELQ